MSPWSRSILLVAFVASVVMVLLLWQPSLPGGPLHRPKPPAPGAAATSRGAAADPLRPVPLDERLLAQFAGADRDAAQELHLEPEVSHAFEGIPPEKLPRSFECRGGVCRLEVEALSDGSDSAALQRVEARLNESRRLAEACSAVLHRGPVSAGGASGRDRLQRYCAVRSPASQDRASQLLDVTAALLDGGSLAACVPTVASGVGLTVAGSEDGGVAVRVTGAAGAGQACVAEAVGEALRRAGIEALPADVWVGPLPVR